MKKVLRVRVNMYLCLKATIVLVALNWCLTGVVLSAPSANLDYWPTEGWRISSLEKQGMSSVKIIRMLEVIREKGYSIQSVTVIRNGYMVLDVYFPSVRKGKLHNLYSCTKSITSAIMGIAIDKGYIKDVNQHVIDYFPDKKIENLDNRKKSIQIKHLLTMSSGIKTEDNAFSKIKWGNLLNMMISDDWVQYALNLPMEYAPGEKYEYSNIASFLLTAVIKKNINRDVLEFAQEHLFTPLGIDNISWDTSPNGIARGWGEMYLTPHDMAKFGWLYLNKGKWENQQIISKKWVNDSAEGHISTRSYYKLNSSKYGYQWWVTPNRYYMAIGYAGQYIIVVPEKKLVAVFTSNFQKEIDSLIPIGLFQRYILLSIESETSIPANQENRVRLETLINEIE